MSKNSKDYMDSLLWQICLWCFNSSSQTSILAYITN